jgi:hypothetical protein
MSLKDSDNLSSLNKKDLVRFNQDPIFEIGKIRELVASFFKKDLNTVLNNYLNSSGVKIWKGTNFEKNERRIKFMNNWFGEGIACNVLKVGDKDWKLGRLKINISVEFEPFNDDDLDELVEVDVDRELLAMKRELDELKRRGLM